MFWFALALLTLALDAVWWIVAMSLAKRRRFWRVLLSIFMAGQIIAHLLLLVNLNFDWYCRFPTAIVATIAIWQRLGVISAVGVLLVLSFVGLCKRCRRRNGSVAPTSVGSLTRREFISTSAALAPALFTMGLTGIAVAQLNHFRVRRFTLRIAALPRPLDGLTLAHVSDIHVGRWTSGRVLRDIVNATNALRPDLVLLTGDLIHFHLSDLSEAIATVKAMHGRFGQWMIEGNHDLFESGTEFARRVRAAGIPLLLDESAVANVRGYPVQFFGLRWMGADKGGDKERDRLIALQLRLLIKQRQPDAFPILLAHHPHAFDAAVKADFPLTLAGHTHGGQIMFASHPGVGSVLFRYWSGLYTRGRSQMIVSNGVGNVFPVRVNAPAEIVHVTLRAA